MTKKQAQPADESDVIPFEKINSEVDRLMRRLRSACPCCVARGLIFRGSHLLADVAGNEEVVEICCDIIEAIEQPDEGEISETHH